jgi:hypothetical protein
MALSERAPGKNLGKKVFLTSFVGNFATAFINPLATC